MTPLTKSEIFDHSGNHVERLVNSNGDVIWFTNEATYKLLYGKEWSKMIGFEFVPCEKPLYEKMYIDFYRLF
jgi:hypothetical protein